MSRSTRKSNFLLFARASLAWLRYKKQAFLPTVPLPCFVRNLTSCFPSFPSCAKGSKHCPFHNRDPSNLSILLCCEQTCPLSGLLQWHCLLTWENSVKCLENFPSINVCFTTCLFVKFFFHLIVAFHMIPPCFLWTDLIVSFLSYPSSNVNAGTFCLPQVEFCYMNLSFRK